METPSWEKLPAEYSTALGQLALGASELDILLTDMAAVFLEVDIFRAIAVFHHQQPANKVSTLKALCHVIYREDDGSEMVGIEKITGVFDRAKIEMDYRNTLIHAYWVVDRDGKPHRVRFSARGKVERNRQPVEVEEIREHVRVIRGLLGELREMREALRSDMKPGPGARLPP